MATRFFQFGFLSAVFFVFGCGKDISELDAQSSSFGHFLLTVDKNIRVLPEAEDDPQNFLKYIDEGRYFTVELIDGSRWQIAASFYGYASTWSPHDPITITQHDYQPSEQFKLVNELAVDLWGNPQEIWGRPEGGLEQLDQFAPQNRRQIRAIDATTSTIRFDDDHLFSVKDITSVSSEREYYVIASDNDEWPYALWDLSEHARYRVIEARLESP